MFHFLNFLSVIDVCTCIKKKRDIEAVQIISLSDTYFFSLVFYASNYTIASLLMIGKGKGNKVNWIAMKKRESFDKLWSDHGKQTASKNIAWNRGTQEPAYHAVKRGAIVFSIGIMRSRVYTRDTSLPYNVIITERTQLGLSLKFYQSLLITISGDLSPSLSSASVTSARNYATMIVGLATGCGLKRIERRKAQWLSLTHERLNISNPWAKNVIIQLLIVFFQ